MTLAKYQRMKSSSSESSQGDASENPRINGGEWKEGWFATDSRHERVVERCLRLCVDPKGMHDGDQSQKVARKFVNRGNLVLYAADSSYSRRGL